MPAALDPVRYDRTAPVTYPLFRLLELHHRVRTAHAGITPQSSRVSAIHKHDRRAIEKVTRRSSTLGGIPTAPRKAF